MPARVLIVDDEATIVEVLTRHLEDRGYQVGAAASAEAALALLDQGPADVILLDNVLPGMTGMEALAQIRRRSAAPVILMTGHFDEEFRRDARLLGAADILAKPFDVEAVAALLARALAKA